MIDESLIASLGIDDAEAQSLLNAAYGQQLSGGQGQYMDSLLGQQIDELIPGKLIKGKIIGFAGDDVVVEVGLKSEGLIPKEEFEGYDLKPGDMVDVLLEDVEGEEGLVQLSKRKADRMLAWQRIMDTTK
ncbi:MAG TPA: S1 RNA-binding domain-containing protein, partial [Phycisphaerales bacterium]|nr:S1 RNA-binding domain-containing protein [Phycisphaerales bacterium]